MQLLYELLCHDESSEVTPYPKNSGILEVVIILQYIEKQTAI